MQTPASSIAHGFHWSLNPSKAHTLILGSMPGQASLKVSEYYAHPRNSFWDIIASLFSIPRSLPYTKRLQKLNAHGIVLWDVVQQCQRSGSLDSAIVNDSIVLNDFNQLFEEAPGIQNIFCNGGKAFSLYKKHVLPALPPKHQTLPVIQLPSTSPAYAAINFAQKTRQWAIITAISQRTHPEIK